MAELSAQPRLARSRDVPGTSSKSSRGSQRKGEHEQATAAGLDLLRVLGWLVLHDVTIPAGLVTGSKEIAVDHLLAGPPGVYVVNTVDWPGAISANDGVLTVGKTDHSDVLAESAAAAAVVRGLLGGTPVASLLCFERLEPVAGFAGDVALCASENILDLLTSQPQILDAGAVARASGRLAAACGAGRGTPAPAASAPAKPAAPAVRRQPDGPTVEELARARAEQLAAEAGAKQAEDRAAPQPAERHGLARAFRRSRRTVDPVAPQLVVAADAASLVEPPVATSPSVAGASVDAESSAAAARLSNAAVAEAGAALWRSLTEGAQDHQSTQELGVEAPEDVVVEQRVDLVDEPDLEAAFAEAEARQREAEERAVPGADRLESEELPTALGELPTPTEHDAELQAQIQAEREAHQERARAAREALEQAQREAMEAEARELAERERLEAEARELAEREEAERAERERLEAEARERAEREAREQAERERLEAEARERAEREAREQAERERLEAEAREQAEREAREQAERERLEAEAREQAEREAREQAERERLEAEAREQAEREAREQAERERLEAEAREQAEREAREQAERERLEAEAREQAEREAREQAERERLEAEARERAEREAREQAERERLEAEAREQAEREAREQAERERLEAEAREQAERERLEAEARERAEREAREQAEREAREQAERERLEAEAREQAERAEREAREQAEREARERAERERLEAEARERAEREAREQAEREARERAERERLEAEAREQAEREERERAEEAERRAVEAREAEEAAARAAWEGRLRTAREAREREAHDAAARDAADPERVAVIRAHQPDVRQAELLLPDSGVEELTRPYAEDEVLAPPAVTTSEPADEVDLDTWEPALDDSWEPEDLPDEELVEPVVARTVSRPDPAEAPVPRERAAARVVDAEADAQIADPRLEAPAAAPRRGLGASLAQRRRRRAAEAEDGQTRHQRLPARAIVNVALGALLIAGVIVGAPRAHDVVSWARDLVTGSTEATTVGTLVQVAADTQHPAVEVLAGTPVDLPASAGGAGKGAHLVVVPVRLHNTGDAPWQVPVAAGTTLRDGLGVTHPVAKAVKTLKGYPLLPGRPTIAPNQETKGYVVFSVPNGRPLTSITVGLSRAGTDAVTWQVSP